MLSGAMIHDFDFGWSSTPALNQRSYFLEPFHRLRKNKNSERIE
jgi:hypothetical protein